MGETKICAPQDFFSDKIASKLKQVDFLIIFEKKFNNQIKTDVIISLSVLQRTERIPYHYQQCERLDNNLL
jgi:hypothetical protein